MNIDLAPSSRQATGIFLVVLSAVLTAVVPTAAKLALEAGATTLTVLSARGLIAVAVLSLAMLATGQRFAIGREALMACLLAGIAYLFMAYGYIGSVAAHSDTSGRLFRQHPVSHSGVSGRLRIVAA